jgi:hypothetical protein
MSFRVPDSVLGNIGQPLDHGIENEREDYNSYDVALDNIAGVIDNSCAPGGELEQECEWFVAGSSRARQFELRR